MVVVHAHNIRLLLHRVLVHLAQMDKSLSIKEPVLFKDKESFVVLAREESQISFVKLVDHILTFLLTVKTAYNVLLV